MAEGDEDEDADEDVMCDMTGVEVAWDEQEDEWWEEGSMSAESMESVC